MKLLVDWPKKILALFIGFGIWLYVFQTGKTKRVYTVSIEIRNKPTHLVSKKPYRKAVQVEVEGEKNLFTNFNPQSIQAILDLRKARKGKNEYLVRLNQLYITAGLSIRILNPLVKINYEEIVSKKVKIIARTEGVVAQGYILKDIEIEPSEVTIRGPESLLRKVKKVYTQIIDINGKFNSFEVSVGIDKISNKIKVKKNQNVNVKLSIAAQIKGRVFKNIPVKVFGLPQKYKIIRGNLKINFVELQGPVAVLQNIKPANINAFIVVTNIKLDSDIEVKIHIAPIKNLKVINYEPKITKIRIAER